MPKVSLVLVRKRVISLLFANRLDPYAGTASRSNSRYQVTQEITDAILEADAFIVQARINTPGDPYRSEWLVPSEDVESGQVIPAMMGATGAPEVGITTDDETVFLPARLAKSRQEILAMRAHPLLYTNAQRWAFIEDGMLYHNGDLGRVWIPQFTKQTACQSPEVDELAVIAQTLGSLPKDGAVTPEIYQAGSQYAQWYVATVIQGKRMPLPEVEQIEAQLAA